MICVIFANYFGTFGINKLGQDITYGIRNDLFDKLQTMSMAYFDRKRSGEIISILTNDVDQVNLLVSGQITQIITSVIALGLSISFMFIANVLLAAFSMIAFPLFLGFFKLFKKKVSGDFKETRKTISKVTTSIQENVAGAKVIQAYNQADKASQEFTKANEENYQANFKVRKTFSTFFPLMQLTTQILTASILTLGGFAYINGINFFGTIVSIGILSAFITYLSQFFQPFMTLMQIQNIIESAMAASDRIYGILEETTDLPDPANLILLKDIKGNIRFQDVSFGYRLDNLNTELKNFIYDEKNNAKKKIHLNKSTNKARWSKFQTVSAMNGSLKNGFQSKIDYNPQLVESIINKLEKSLVRRESLQKSPASNRAPSGEGGASMGQMGSPDEMKSRQLARMIAQLSIPKEEFNSFPKMVQDCIEEERVMIEHENSIGFILKNLDLSIEGGNTIAIVGETGAGKTTMIKLIARFYDVNKGKIAIDGNDIRDITKNDLRKNIGLVPQDSFLFKGTIRENLLYGLDAIDDEIERKMLDISKFLGLYNFIMSQPEGFETILHENASNISIGQRQLIAFARALITDPKILILDEATSSVDPYTETLIQDALNKARKGRTTIIIAHRLSTIRNADLILVVDKEAKGFIEKGTHDELLAIPNGVYKHLLDMQNMDIESN